jgi:hypothetical protein
VGDWRKEMNKFYVKCNADGLVTDFKSLSPDLDISILNEALIEVEEEIEPGKAYIENGKLIKVAEEIPDGYQFDARTKKVIVHPFRKAKLDRTKRNELLKNTDHYMLEDSRKNKNAWAKYRQALRDITEQPGFPHDVEWPEPPREAN